MSSNPQATQSQSAQPEPARRPSSQRRIRSSRANGALSRGPKTPEGKQRSSRNATRHGIFAGPDLLPHESPGSYHQLRQAYFRCFAPQDPLTRRLVQQLVSAVWRLRRLWGIETAAFDRELSNHLLPSGPERLAAAFTSLAVRSRQFDLVHRYETRLHLICRRALRSLVDLRNARVQIEPSPGIEHPHPGDCPPPQTPRLLLDISDSAVLKPDSSTEKGRTGVLPGSSSDVRSQP